MGQKPNFRTPSPNPTTEIGSIMGGEFTQSNQNGIRSKTVLIHKPIRPIGSGPGAIAGHVDQALGLQSQHCCPRLWSGSGRSVLWLGNVDFGVRNPSDLWGGGRVPLVGFITFCGSYKLWRRPQKLTSFGNCRDKGQPKSNSFCILRHAGALGGMSDSSLDES